MSSYLKNETKALVKLRELEVCSDSTIIRRDFGYAVYCKTIKGTPVLVTIGCIFPDPSSEPGCKIVADRFSAKQKSHRQDIDPASVKATKNISIITYIGSGEDFPLLCRDMCQNPPTTLSAVAFEGKETVELTFRSSNKSGFYKLAKVSPDDFVANRAVGAPIIHCDPDTNTSSVIGVLKAKKNGGLYPVLFTDVDLELMDTQGLGNLVASCNLATEDSDLGAHGSIHESSAPSSGMQSQVFKEEDRTDSPVTQPQQSGGSYNIVHGHQGHQGKKVSETQAVEMIKCTKKLTIAEAPGSESLLNELEMLLDPIRHLGGDYRSLAGTFRYNNNQIEFLKAHGFPTRTLLLQERTSLSALGQKLVSIGRSDAVEKLDKYVQQEGCNCNDCGGHR